MNFFNQGIPLGRWFGITVVIHWTFLLYAGFKLLGSASHGAQIVGFEVLFIGLLFGTVLLHEFGHALSCKMVGGDAFHIVLWPLGGIAFVQPPMKPWAWLITTVCGPLVNAVLWPVFWILSALLWPMHNDSTAMFVIWIACDFLADINMALLLFNLIPGYPMDGGRMLQEFLWLAIGYQRSLQIAGMVGTVVGVGFVALGLGLRSIKVPVVNFTLGQEGQTNGILIVIGILVAMQSFGIYKRSEEIRGWRKN